jgi:hypothetical protein
MYHHYYASMRWNSIETIYYRILYSSYIALVYTYASTQDFSITGTVFSLVYAGVTVLDGGLSASLSPFFIEMTRSAHTLKKVLSYHVKIYALIVTILLIGALTMHASLWHTYQLFIKTPQMLGILTGIVVLETAKKALKKFVQLSLAYRATAIVEMLGITLFFALISLYILYAKQISPEVIFGSFLASSLFSVTILLLTAIKSSASLHTSTDESPLSLYTLAKTRAYLYANNLINMQFSSNILLPIIAAKYGFEIIVPLKLIGTLAHTVSSLLEHSINLSSDVLYAHLKRDSIDTVKHIFSLSQKQLLMSITACSVVCMGAIRYGLLSTVHIETTYSALLLYTSYFILLATETLFSQHITVLTMYEQFTVFSYIKIITIVGMIYITKDPHIALPTLVISMLALRIASYSILTWHATYANFRAHPVKNDVNFNPNQNV